MAAPNWRWGEGAATLQPQKLKFKKHKKHDDIRAIMRFTPQSSLLVYQQPKSAEGWYSTMEYCNREQKIRISYIKLTKPMRLQNVT